MAISLSSAFFFIRLRSSRAAAISGLLLLREGALRCLDFDLARRRDLASSDRLLADFSNFSSFPRSSDRKRRRRVRGDLLDDFLTFFLWTLLVAGSSTSARSCSSSSMGGGGGGGGGVACDILRWCFEEEDEVRFLDEERLLFLGDMRFLCSLTTSSLLSPLSSVKRFRAWTGMGLLDFFLEALLRGDTCFLDFLDRSENGLDRSDEGLVSLRKEVGAFPALLSDVGLLELGMGESTKNSSRGTSTAKDDSEAKEVTD